MLLPRERDMCNKQPKTISIEEKKENGKSSAAHRAWKMEFNPRVMDIRGILTVNYLHRLEVRCRGGGAPTTFLCPPPSPSLLFFCPARVRKEGKGNARTRRAPSSSSSSSSSSPWVSTTMLSRLLTSSS
mmetsp:Transcript_53025/g.128655  ORF Transcript_53025/g.128655 Transcript_53025/m.128655 type:complete len:129 (-) Transcript_53025:166-552(-)